MVGKFSFAWMFDDAILLCEKPVLPTKIFCEFLSAKTHAFRTKPNKTRKYVVYRKVYKNDHLKNFVQANGLLLREF